MLKKCTSFIVAFAMLITLFSGTGVYTAFADETASEKIVVYVALEGQDNNGHKVDIAKTPVQVDEGTKADVAVKQVLDANGYTQKADPAKPTAEKEYDLSDPYGYGANLNGIGAMEMAQLDEKNWLFWAFYLNGKSSSLSLGNVELKDGDEIGFTYTTGGDTYQCRGFVDDNSKDPDSAKRSALIAAAKKQQAALADAVFKKYFGEGTSDFGIDTPDELYVAYSLIDAGYNAGDFYQNLYDQVAKQIKNLKDNGKIDESGKLDTTDKPFGPGYDGSGNNIELSLAKIVLFLTALKKDAANIEGVNLIQIMVNKENYTASAGAYMLDCTMLLALDSKDYTLPVGEGYITRAELVNRLLSEIDSNIGSVVNEGWTADSAAMPIQPLYKYTQKDHAAGVDAAAAKKQTEKVLRFLEKIQGTDGVYGDSYMPNNVWTLAQIMSAASAFHIPLTMSWKEGEMTHDFIKNGVTLFDVASAFFDGSTEVTVKKDFIEGYQPEQLLRGLNAAIRVAEETEKAISVKPNGGTKASGSQTKTSVSGKKKTTNACVSLKAVKKKVVIKKGKKAAIVFKIKAKDSSKKTTDKRSVKITNKKKAKVKKINQTKKKITVTVLGKKKGTTKLVVRLGKKKATVKVIVK